MAAAMKISSRRELRLLSMFESPDCLKAPSDAEVTACKNRREKRVGRARSICFRRDLWAQVRFCELAGSWANVLPKAGSQGRITLSAGKLVLSGAGGRTEVAAALLAMLGKRPPRGPVSIEQLCTRAAAASGARRLKTAAKSAV